MTTGENSFTTSLLISQPEIQYKYVTNKELNQGIMRYNNSTLSKIQDFDARLSKDSVHLSTSNENSSLQKQEQKQRGRKKRKNENKILQYDISSLKTERGTIGSKNPNNFQHLVLPPDINETPDSLDFLQSDRRIKGPDRACIENLENSLQMEMEMDAIFDSGDQLPRILKLVNSNFEKVHKDSFTVKTWKNRAEDAFDILGPERDIKVLIRHVKSESKPNKGSNTSNSTLEELESQDSNLILSELVDGLTPITKTTLFGSKLIENAKLLKNATQFDFSNQKLTSIEHISSVGKISSLNLRFNNISDLETSINAINSLIFESLTLLDISHNNLVSISPLFNLPSLIHLYLSHNKISTVSGIDKLYNLTTLDISNNKLTNLVTASENLRKLPQLEILILKDNPMTLIESSTKTGLSNSNSNSNAEFTQKIYPDYVIAIVNQVKFLDYQHLDIFIKDEKAKMYPQGVEKSRKMGLVLESEAIERKKKLERKERMKKLFLAELSQLVKTKIASDLKHPDLYPVYENTKWRIEFEKQYNELLSQAEKQVSTVHFQWENMMKMYLETKNSQIAKFNKRKMGIPIKNPLMLSKYRLTASGLRLNPTSELTPGSEDTLSENSGDGPASNTEDARFSSNTMKSSSSRRQQKKRRSMRSRSSRNSRNGSDDTPSLDSPKMMTHVWDIKMDLEMELTEELTNLLNEYEEKSLEIETNWDQITGNFFKRVRELAKSYNSASYQVLNSMEANLENLPQNNPFKRMCQKGTNRVKTTINSNHDVFLARIDDLEENLEGRRQRAHDWKPKAMESDLKDHFQRIQDLLGDKPID